MGEAGGYAPKAGGKGLWRLVVRKLQASLGAGGRNFPWPQPQQYKKICFPPSHLFWGRRHRVCLQPNVILNH